MIREPFKTSSANHKTRANSLYCPNMYIYCGQVVNSTPDIIDEMIKILITKLNILFRQEFELKLEGNLE